MAYVYNEVNWEDLPSTNTPRNATNLGNMDTGIKENNNMLNGTKSMSSIAVEDINCKNMFNQYSVIKNAGVNNGVIFSTSDYNIFVIKVVPNKKYTISKTSYNAGLIGYYNTFPTIGDTITNMQTLRDITNLTITAQDNYLCIMLSKNDDIETVQVEIGETATTYVDYKNLDATYKYDVLQKEDIAISNTAQSFSIRNPKKYDRIRVRIDNSYGRSFFVYFEKYEFINENYYVHASVISMADGTMSSFVNARITLNLSTNNITVVYEKSNATFPLTLKNIVGFYRGSAEPIVVSGNRSITPEEEETR